MGPWKGSRRGCPLPGSALDLSMASSACLVRIGRPGLEGSWFRSVLCAPLRGRGAGARGGACACVRVGPSRRVCRSQRPAPCPEQSPLQQQHRQPLRMTRIADRIKHKPLQKRHSFHSPHPIENTNLIHFFGPLLLVSLLLDAAIAFEGGRNSPRDGGRLLHLLLI